MSENKGSVHFKYLVPPTGVKPVTTYADSLMGPDRAPYMGDNWYLVATQSNLTGGPDTASQINISNSGLTYGDGTAKNNNDMVVLAFPSQVSYPATVIKSLLKGLFVQWTVVSKNAGTDCSPGMFVFGNPGGEGCYYIRTDSQDNQTRVHRNVGGSDTVLNNNVFSNTAGDIIRMEVFIDSPVAGTNTLKCYKNGVLGATLTDSSVSRLTSGGSFGICFLGVFQGQVTVATFSGGTL